MLPVTTTRVPVDRRIVPDTVHRPVTYQQPTYVDNSYTYHPRTYRVHHSPNGQAIVITLIALGLMAFIGACTGFPVTRVRPGWQECVTYKECDHFFGLSSCRLVEECIPI